MSEGYQIQNVLRLIEFVDDAVITYAHSILRSTFESVMRICAEA